MGFFDYSWNVHLKIQGVGLQETRFHFVHECFVASTNELTTNIEIIFPIVVENKFQT